MLPTYKNPKAAIADRVQDLLGRMSREDKVGQMLQLDARDGARDLIENMRVGSILHASADTIKEAHEVTVQTQLQIPLLIADDLIHGYSFWPGATIFPTQLGMAATWDRDLAYDAARITALEATQTGVHWTFSPVLCIARDLRWGRVDETFGEDPYLISELASAMVAGYQGDGLDDPTALLATAKHFAGYSETQGGRDASEADLSQRKLRSWFLPPFERVAREGTGTFMLGYQTTDGVPITVNKWLLTDVLRGEWDYPGVLVTDWDNVGRMVWEQRVQPDYKHAAAAAVLAGNDVIMSTPQFYEGALAALEEGLITDADVDQAVARILTLKFRLGLFEDVRPPHTPCEQRAVIGCAQHQHTNLEMARRSLVLLKNDGTLPLIAAAGEQSGIDGSAKRIAVVGPLADDAQGQLGDWAGNSGQINWMPEGHPREGITTVLDGLRNQAPSSWGIRYAKGATICHLEPDPEGETWPDGQPRWPIAVADAPDPKMIGQAVKEAAAADYIVAVVGDSIEMVGETRSTATLELQGGQLALLEALAEVSAADNKPLIVVLIASKPLVLPPAVMDAAALIWAANPGQQGGRAVAELILGQIEPTGRLPISFARHVGQQPIYYNQIRSQHGKRYADLTQDPAFAFGEGLSYSAVEYGLVSLDGGTFGDGFVMEFKPDETVTATVEVSNIGARPVLETVQGYVRDMVTSASWTDRELKAYKQVWLRPGETRKVELEVPVSQCSIVDAQGNRVVEPGEFELLVGSSSRDADLQAVAFRVI